MPLRITLRRRELEDFQKVAVGIFEVKRADARSSLNVRGQELRPGGRMLNLVLAQPLVGAVHFTRDDGDMLEPAVVSARLRRERPSTGRKIFGELDELVAESHAHDSHTQAKDA